MTCTYAGTRGLAGGGGAYHEGGHTMGGGGGDAATRHHIWLRVQGLGFRDRIYHARCGADPFTGLAVSFQVYGQDPTV